MNSFDNKEKAEENRYAHDKEVEFLIHSRYHKLLALWVAAKAGLDADKTLEYKNSFISSTMDKNDDNTLYAKLSHDLLVNEVHMGEHDIRETMYGILQDARKQVMERE